MVIDFPNCSSVFEMESISFSNANPISLSNGYTFICLSVFSCFMAALCTLLKLSCCFFPIVLDKTLLTVCRRFSADVSFLPGSNFSAYGCNYFHIRYKFWCRDKIWSCNFDSLKTSSAKVDEISQER